MITSWVDMLSRICFHDKQRDRSSLPTSLAVQPGRVSVSDFVAMTTLDFGPPILTVSDLKPFKHCKTHSDKNAVCSVASLYWSNAEALQREAVSGLVGDRVPEYVDGDGNCFWASIALTLWNTVDPEVWRHLKLAVLLYAVRHRAALAKHPLVIGDRYGLPNLGDRLLLKPSDYDLHQQTPSWVEDVLVYNAIHQFPNGVFSSLLEMVATAMFLNVTIVTITPLFGLVGGAEGDERNLVISPSSFYPISFARPGPPLSADKLIVLMYSNSKMQTAVSTLADKRNIRPTHFVPMLLRASRR
jgi:hypothetical protein